MESSCHVGAGGGACVEASCAHSQGGGGLRGVRSWEGRAPAGELPFPTQGTALSPALLCPTRRQRLALAPTATTLAARLGARAPKDRLGYPNAAGLGVRDSVCVCVCVCEHVRMETRNPATSVSHLGVTRQEMRSPVWDVPGVWPGPWSSGSL